MNAPTSLISARELERPVKVTISYTHTCNLDCAICYADCGRNRGRKELSAAEWIRFLDQAAADGVIGFYFEGGEPLHRSDFLSVAAHAATLGMTMVRTHGTLLSSAAVGALKSARVASVYVDLWGATAGTHDALTGVPGSYDATVEGIRTALAGGLRTQMLIIMNRRNVHELQAWADLAYALGVRSIGVLRPYPIGRMRRRWSEFSLSLSAMMAAIRALRTPEDLRVMQSWHPNDANCCWQAAAVNAWGDSIGCAYLREFVNHGNIRDQTLAQTWDAPLYRRLRTTIPNRSCGTCSASQRSDGGCRSTAYAFHGRWDAPDPFDEGINDGVDLQILPGWMRAETPEPPS
jgi:radical SAM protein with 4Fe4S-binding SPASM domain